MENCYSLIKKSIFLALFLFAGANIFAQTVLKGFVKDAITMEPIPFVSVYFKGNNGVMTGDDGSHSIETKNANL